jgi:hypothetical protein
MGRGRVCGRGEENPCLPSRNESEMNENAQQALTFLERHYRALREPYTPMAWMRRLFLRLVAGEPPRLVDLPTGTGKTDLIVVWLIALAWFANHRDSTPAIPRRLVWVVNRRVLVQQVYELSERLSRLARSGNWAIPGGDGIAPGPCAPWRGSRREPQVGTRPRCPRHCSRENHRA